MRSSSVYIGMILTGLCYQVVLNWGGQRLPLNQSIGIYKWDIGYGIHAIDSSWIPISELQLFTMTLRLSLRWDVGHPNQDPLPPIAPHCRKHLRMASSTSTHFSRETANTPCLERLPLGRPRKRSWRYSNLVDLKSRTSQVEGRLF